MKKITVLLLVLFLGGCSTKFAYNNISWLVYWYLDDYVELNAEQESQFDEMLATWMQWHKSEELPKYQAHLQDIIDDVRSRALNEDKLNAHRERARQHWVRARTYVAPDIVELASTLSNEQIDYFFTQLEKENIEDEKDMQERSELTPEERAKKWNKRNQDNIKRWMGKLNSEQKAHVASFYDRFQSTGQYWLAYKREYQGQLKAVFEKQGRGEDFENALRQLIVNPEQFRSEQFQGAMDTNTQAGNEYILGLLASASDKQINKLINEVDEYKDDIISLQK